MSVSLPDTTRAILPDHNPVAIIGAGPVGLIASLLLSKYRVNHVLIDQLTQPDIHPQAHFINCRTVEILRELNGLDQIVYDLSAPVNEWRRFVYCTRLYGLPAISQIKPEPGSNLLGVVDHFANGDDKAQSPARVTHFPQHEFVRLLRHKALESAYCYPFEGYRAGVCDNKNRVKVILTNYQTGRRQHFETQYVIAADGAHSVTRKQLGIEINRETETLQNLLNVHFFSTQLAEQLRCSIPAMLYFVYASSGVAVFVTHSLKRGEFVAQIPFFPPHQQVEDYDHLRCKILLQRLAGFDHYIDIRSVRTWRMGVGEASFFRSKSGRCFLVGDAAHQFTPAGGFGMNTGIQDAHNLVWKIATALQLEREGRLDPIKPLLTSYERERRPVAVENAKMSIENFLVTLRVPDALGLKLNFSNYISRIIDRLPGPQTLKSRLFNVLLKLGLKQVDWLKYNNPLIRRRWRALRTIFSDQKKNTLQLLFSGQDIGFVYNDGLLFSKVNGGSIPANPHVFEPALQIGGRMPHFWIEDSNGQKFSVLDLPTLVMGDDGRPCYVMLQTAEMNENADHFSDDTRPSVVNVHICDGSSRTGAARYSFFPNRPDFLPSSFAALMRPDGHIAWLQIC